MYNIAFRNVVAADVNYVFEPSSYGNEKPKHKMKILMYKDDPQCNDLKKVLVATAVEAFSRPLPKGFVYPTHDSDEEEIHFPYERNSRYFWAKTYKPPIIVDDCGNTVTADSGKLHQGSFVDVDLSFKAYDWAKGKGITVYLNKVVVHEDPETQQHGSDNIDSDQQPNRSYRDTSAQGYSRRGYRDDDGLPDRFPPQPGDDDFDLLNL